MNNDGTNVDSDKELVYYGEKGEVFLLLALGQTWIDPRSEIIQIPENSPIDTLIDSELNTEGISDEIMKKNVNLDDTTQNESGYSSEKEQLNGDENDAANSNTLYNWHDYEIPVDKIPSDQVLILYSTKS